MRRCCFLFIVFVLSLCCVMLISCSSTKIEPELDLTSIIDPILLQRPDNSTIMVKAGPILELADVVSNSAQYLKAWELWENYADMLEKTIGIIEEKMASH